MRAQLGRLDIIAEDLGDISDSVRRLLRDTGFPGMRVLQFGLRAREDSLHLPHNYIQNCAAYTGTHDNDTIMGWFDSAPEEDRLFAADYLRAASREDFAAAAVSAVYASPASLAVIPMQDWLGLGAQARMNIPATASGNWSWRCPQGALTDELAARMRHVAGVYRRG
jgi:4-alpha-glucanotransferase